AGGGGTGHSGTIFRLTAEGTEFTLIQSFDYASTGGYPTLYGGLTCGSDGALYGAATLGGSYGFGTVFKLNSDGTGFTALHHFNNDTSGAYPIGGVIQGSDGLLYGT